MPIVNIERIGADFEVHHFGKVKPLGDVDVFIVEVRHSEASHARELAKGNRSVGIRVWTGKVAVIQVRCC